MRWCSWSLASRSSSLLLRGSALDALEWMIAMCHVEATWQNDEGCVSVVLQATTLGQVVPRRDFGATDSLSKGRKARATFAHHGTVRHCNYIGLLWDPVKRTSAGSSMNHIRLHSRHSNQHGPTIHRQDLHIIRQTTKDTSLFTVMDEQWLGPRISLTSIFYSFDAHRGQDAFAYAHLRWPEHWLIPFSMRAGDLASSSPSW